MTDHAAPSESPILTASHIGVLGDTHGDLEHVFHISRMMAGHEIQALLVLGDFGFIWPEPKSSRNLDRLAKRLAEHSQTLYFVDGNHEYFPKLLEYPIADDGLRYVRPNIVHLPRGTRLTLKGGLTLAALGGANSADRHLRVPGKEWWAEEQIQDSDLAALGHDPVDVLVGHEAPMPLPTLDRNLPELAAMRPPEINEYIAEGRRQFTRGFMQVRPRLFMGGHYHRHLDETLSFGHGDDTFESRVVILDMNGRKGVNSAVLNTSTLELRFLDRADYAVMELRGTETGRWKVHTRDSVQLFDFDAGTVERIPGPNARPTNVDHPRPLLAIRKCRVGERGFWDIRSHDFLIDSYWVLSSVIRRIERLPRGSDT